jgi:hypothetical protein
MHAIARVATRNVLNGRIRYLCLRVFLACWFATVTVYQLAIFFVPPCTSALKAIQSTPDYCANFVPSCTILRPELCPHTLVRFVPCFFTLLSQIVPSCTILHLELCPHTLVRFAPCPFALLSQIVPPCTTFSFLRPWPVAGVLCGMSARSFST